MVLKKLNDSGWQELCFAPNIALQPWFIHNTVRRLVPYCLHFTFMHLADAFIQSDLQCIQAIHLYGQYVCSLGIEPTTFALLTQRSKHWATGTLFIAYLLSSLLSPFLVKGINRPFVHLSSRWMLHTGGGWGIIDSCTPYIKIFSIVMLYYLNNLLYLSFNKNLKLYALKAVAVFPCGIKNGLEYRFNHCIKVINSSKLQLQIEWETLEWLEYLFHTIEVNGYNQLFWLQSFFKIPSFVLSSSKKGWTIPLKPPF